MILGRSRISAEKPWWKEKWFYVRLKVKHQESECKFVYEPGKVKTTGVKGSVQSANDVDHKMAKTKFSVLALQSFLQTVWGGG